jgi:threonine/homoserine/homoserine lactone efflux protein
MVPVPPEQLLPFLGAALLVTAAPGPDSLMVLSTGIARGRRHGMAFGLGCAIGCLSHTVLAALGVSALIAASPTAFAALRLCGGLYLLWLGAKALRSRGERFRPDSEPRPDSLSRLFLRGLIANAVNPKVILFFLAFLPQFVTVPRGGAGWQMLELGCLFALLAALLFGALGWFAGQVGAWLARRPGASAWLDRLAGSVFALLGLKLLACR